MGWFRTLLVLALLLVGSGAAWMYAGITLAEQAPAWALVDGGIAAAWLVAALALLPREQRFLRCFAATMGGLIAGLAVVEGLRSSGFVEDWESWLIPSVLVLGAAGGIAGSWGARPAGSPAGRAWIAIAGLLRLATCFVVAMVPLAVVVNYTHQGPTQILVDLVDDGRFPLSEQRAFVGMMRDIYLWSDELPPVRDPGSMKMDALLEQLRNKKQDRFSFVEPLDKAFSAGAGSFKGVGLSWKRDQEGNVRIGLVLPGSPAEKAGVKRGMLVASVNGVDIAGLPKEGRLAAVSRAAKLGDGTVDVEVEEGGARRKFSMVRTTVTKRMVQNARVLDAEGARVGYLLFLGFEGDADKSLRSAFRDFKKAGVTDLVVDLRYNPGGAVLTADLLASLIAGPELAGKVFQYTKANARYPKRVVPHLFKPEPQSLGMKRVVFLTTGQSCSASEAMINGLRPYLQVWTVGTTTCGKPFGMQVMMLGGWSVAPLSFEVLNAKMEGRYVDGIVADCHAADDLTREFGDPEEGMLAEALHVVRKGECSDIRSRGAAGVIDSDVPETGARRYIGSY